MENQEKKKVKVVFRSSPLSLKVILTVVIIFSMAALGVMRLAHLGLQAETEKLSQEAAAVEYENGELREKAQNADSVQGIEDIARDEFGLVDPNTVVISPTDPTETTS